MSRWSDDSEALFDAERDTAGPSREARARMRAKVMARVGRGAAVAAAATTTATAVRNAGAASGALAAGGGTAGGAVAGGAAKGALLSLALKIAAPVVLAGALGAAATGVIRGRHAGSSQAIAVSPVGAPARVAAQTLAPAMPVARPTLAARVVAAEPAPAIAAPAAAAPATRASHDATTTRLSPILPPSPRASALPPPAPPVPDALVAQLTGVGAIEDALRRGDPALALARADDYARAYPRGAFGEEAAGARVIALCTIARTPDSARAAAAFAQSHPASLLLLRIDAACDTARGEAHDSITDLRRGGQ